MGHHFAVLGSGRDLAGPPHESGNTEGPFEGRPFLAAIRGRPGVGIGVLPSSVVARENHDGIRCLGADRVENLADVGIEFHHGVGVVPEVRATGEFWRGICRVVHLHEVHVHEEGFVVFRVLLDVFDRRGSLAVVELREVRVVDQFKLFGWLAGDAFPRVAIDDRVEHLFELRVVRREPGMEPLRCVGVGVNAGVVGGEFLHLVEAVLDRIGNGLVAEMPLAGEGGAVAVLFEELGDGRRLGAEIIFIAGSDDDREGGADRDAPGDK